MMKERLPLATALRCSSIHSQAVKPDGSIIMLQFGTSVLDSSSQLLVIENHCTCYALNPLCDLISKFWAPIGDGNSSVCSNKYY